MAEVEKEESRVLDLEARLQFEKNLRQLINRIHNVSLDEILIAVKDDIQQLIKCDRVTIYAKDPNKNEIYSKVLSGEEINEIRIPISIQSIAGYVALTRKAIRIKDVYDSAELSAVDQNLRFDQSWDKRTGFRTKQMLVVPIVSDARLYGVIQVINSKKRAFFTNLDEEIVMELSKALAIAFRNQTRLSFRSSRYDYLMREEIITSETLDKAQAVAQQKNCSMDQALVTDLGIPKEALAKSLSEFFRVEYIAYSDKIPMPEALLQHFTVDWLKHYVCCPISIDGSKIIIAMENPRNLLARDDIKRKLADKDKNLGQKEVVVKVAIREDVMSFIDYFYGLVQAKGKQEDFGKIVEDIEAEEAEEGGAQSEEKEEVKEDDTGIVRLVNQIIEQAYFKNASDIHLEPYPETDMVVRVRVDGVCYEHAKIPKKFSKAIAARLKIMAQLDITERRIPQDGKIKFKNYGSLDIELRVATLPTTGGQEDVVMRILASSKPIPIDKIGMTPDVLEKFKKIADSPYGLILCVGPTGSGKTTTLHSCLGFLNTPEWKIWTAEDPVEITQRGLRQVQVVPKIGFTFEKALRAFLRADPDIILIGEMRDLETASAGIECSLTGHMVFSTLHTNNAPETITRLLDMGLDPFVFGDSLLAVLAQRLIRRVCSNCREERAATQQELDELKRIWSNDETWDKMNFTPEKTKMAKGKGCETCNKTGYKGRMGIHELLLINDEIKLMIFKKEKSEEIREVAIKNGMYTLVQDGIRKMLTGQTDMKEIKSVATK